MNDVNARMILSIIAALVFKKIETNVTFFLQKFSNMINHFFLSFVN